MSDHTVTAARDVPVEAIKAGLASVDWDMVRAGHADPKQAAGHAIRYAAVALRAQIAADIRQSSIDMQDAADTFAVGSYSGTVALKAEGMYQAARIAEGGNTK